MKALSIDEKYEDAWNSLGTSLSPAEPEVVNGTPYTRRECFVKALSIDERYAHAWYSLGLTLSPKEQIMVPKVNGTLRSKRFCLYEALRLYHEKGDPMAYGCILLGSLCGQVRETVEGVTYLTQNEYYNLQGVEYPFGFREVVNQTTLDGYKTSEWERQEKLGEGIHEVWKYCKGAQSMATPCRGYWQIQVFLQI